MFYQDEIDNALRFGDVLKGFILAESNLKEPDPKEKYKIEINLPDYCVILSPCCSIGQKVISLSPLLPIKSSFFENPYFAEDLKRINRKMNPEQSVSPAIWESFSPEEKQKRLNEGYNYAVLEIFIYEEKDFFPKYVVKKKGGGEIETNCYMIDFRNTYKISCDKINSARDAPLNTKCLQISIQTRSELRDKIAYYYSRPAPEDKIAED